MSIKDKVAIVTGASSGIGLATAKLLSQKGVKVALVARSRDILEKLSKTLPESFVVVTDMRKADEIKEMVQKVFNQYGRIDILVNNAGRGYDASIEKIDVQMFQELIDLDLFGPLIAMQAVIPFMKKQGSGVIVNISSGTALMAIPNLGAYSSLKRALTGLSLTAAEELKGDNIMVSAVYPFITATNFHKNIMGGGRERLPQSDIDYMSKADTPQYVAEKILEAITTGEKEIFVHDWMGKGK